MNLLFWGLTIGMIGKVMLAIGVLIAHSELAHEKKIDLRVLKSFRLEHTLTVTGIILILSGYLMEIYFYDFVSMLTCAGEECVLNASAILSQ
jgi:hypothetical protein